MSFPIANRQEVLQQFREMLTSQTSSPRLLLVKAESGYGKTYLLNYFREKCSQKSIKVVPITLKNSEYGTLDVLNSFYEELGQPYFPQYHNYLQGLQSNTDINISRNINLGGNTQIIVSNNKDGYEQQLIDLTQFFLVDLRTLSRSNPNDKIVTLIDDYDQADATLQRKICWLLEKVVKIPVLLIVIGGKEVPEPNNLVWEKLCSYLELKAITDSRYWSKFFKNYQCPFGEDVIKAITTLGEGRPSSIRDAFDKLRRDWK